MRIVCDNCGAKYSIADDKIAGKRSQVRCKKCSEMIIVDGTGIVGSEAVPVPGDASAPGAWFVVIEGAQEGPFSQEEVSAKLAAGSIDGETFAWCEGMGDWDRLATIDAFSDEVAAAPVSHLSQIAEVPAFVEEETRVVGAAEAESIAGAYVSAAGPPSVEAFSAPEPTPSQSGLFSAVDAPKSESLSSFFSSTPTAAPAEAPAPASASHSAGFTGERSESSALFSLSDLTAKRKTSAIEVPTTEASGLIDIRMLAQAPAPVAAEEASGDRPVAPATIAMAPVIALPARRSNTPMVLGLAIGGVLIVGLLVALLFVLNKEPPAPEVVVVPAPAQEPVAAAPAEEPATPAAPVEEAQPTPEDQLAAASGGDDEAAAAGDDAAGAGEPAAPQEEVAAAATTRNTDRAPATRDSDSGAARNDPPATPTPSTRPTQERAPQNPPTPTPSTRPRNTDAVDDALAAITGGSSGSRSSTTRQEPAAAAPAGRTTLSSDEVRAVVRRYGSRIQACRSGGEPEEYRVTFVIQPTGRVSNARADRSTDVSQCLVGVVRDMQFPTFQGEAKTVPYPFRL